MTREEAIKILKSMSDISTQGEAIDMAIKALSADAVGYETTATINEPISIQSNYAYVVRCKECRWWNSETNGCKRNPSLEAWYETDFCKYGERQCNYFGERREP